MPGVTVPGLGRILQKYPKAKAYAHKEDIDELCRATGISRDRLHITQQGDQIRIGRHQLTFLHTPGHTPGSQCIRVNEGRMITGDTIFCGSCGRTDLPGGNAKILRKTLQRLSEEEFPDDMVVYPGHAYNGTRSTWKKEKDVGFLGPLKATL